MKKFLILLLSITSLHASMFDGVFVYSSTGSAPPAFTTFGSSLVWSGSTLVIDGSQLTGIPYASLTGAPSIPAAQVQTDWNAVSGLGVLLNKPTLSAVAISGSYSSLAGLPSLFSGTYADLAGKPSLATVATTGAYSDLTGKPTIPSGSVTSVAISSTNLTVSGTVTSSGTLSVNLPAVGTSGTYTTVVTDAQGRVTSGSGPSTAVITRTSGTSPASFQISTTQNCLAIYNVTITNSVNIISLTSVFGQVELQTSTTSSGPWTTVSRVRNATTVGLAIALSLTDTADYSFSGYVPAGYWVRLLRTGAASITDLPGSETKL